MQTIYDIFQDLGIEYKLHDHPAFYTCEESSKWYAENLEMESGESKNLFIRNKKGNKHYLVVIESHKQLDLKHLREILHESKLSFASPERLQKYLNLTPGSVSVLALTYENAKEVEVIFDEDLLKHKSLHYHPPGRNDQTVVLSTEDLKKFLEWVENPIKFMAL